MLEILLAQALNFDNSFTEKLGEMCDNNNKAACEVLVKVTDGQCAGPKYSGCRYDSADFTEAQAPMFGAVPASILKTCLTEVGVAEADDLITDADFDTYESCMIQYLGEV